MPSFWVSECVLQSRGLNNHENGVSEYILYDGYNKEPRKKALQVVDFCVNFRIRSSSGFYNQGFRSSAFGCGLRASGLWRLGWRVITSPRPQTPNWFL